MKKFLTISSLALSTALAAPASAQDDDVVMEEEADSASIVTFSGFVDTSVYIPLTGFPADSDHVTFGLDQVEVDIEAAPADGLTLRTDLNVFPAAGMLLNDDLVEQGFIDWECDNGLFLRAGKVNAPIGAEGIDPVDLYQYSQGQLFTSATPSNLTGFFGGYRGDSISAQVWVSNDWDTPGGGEPTVTPGLRLEYAFEPGHVGLSSTYGPAVADDPYLMIDVDTGLGFGDLTILGEFNFGTSDALETLGFLATFSYAISESVSATLRGDYLSQTMTDATTGLELDMSNVSLTAAGLFTLTDNFGLVSEIRADLPDGGDTVLAGALELLAWW